MPSKEPTKPKNKNTVATPRGRRVSVSLSDGAFNNVKAAAEEVGLSVNAWCAYTLGSAAANQTVLRQQMTAGMVSVLRQAVAEGVMNDEIPK